MMSTTLLEQYGVTQLVGTGSALSRNQPLQQQVAAQYKNIPFKKEMHLTEQLWPL
jgi:hypothetical protein